MPATVTVLWILFFPALPYLLFFFRVRISGASSWLLNLILASGNSERAKSILCRGNTVVNRRFSQGHGSQLRTPLDHNPNLPWQPVALSTGTQECRIPRGEGWEDGPVGKVLALYYRVFQSSLAPTSKPFCTLADRQAPNAFMVVCVVHPMKGISLCIWMCSGCAYAML